MPARIALVSAAAAQPLDEDLAPLLAALAAAGADARVVDWDDPAVEWAGFDLALLRSPWDYTQRLEAFLDWLARAAAQTVVHNPLHVVQWNTDKHYLADLERAGVAIVPSAFVEPGVDAAATLDAFLAVHACAEFVIKPSVGAGSRDAQRHGRGGRAAALAHLQRLLDSGRSALLQPYLARVDDHGETALVYFDGRYSHAIRKGALLRANEESTRALFAEEHIAAREPSPAERALAERALAAIPAACPARPPHANARAGESGAESSADAPLLYARVDLIHDDDGTPRLLELELAEPSLFFAHGTGSARRFADALLARVGASPSPA